MFEYIIQECRDVLEADLTKVPTAHLRAAREVIPDDPEQRTRRLVGLLARKHMATNKISPIQRGAALVSLGQKGVSSVKQPSRPLPRAIEDPEGAMADASLPRSVRKASNEGDEEDQAPPAKAFVRRPLSRKSSSTELVKA